MKHFLLAAILASGSGSLALADVRYNGVELTSASALGERADAASSAGEPLLLTAGPDLIAGSLRGSPLTLADHFDALGYDYLGPIGSEGALLMKREASSAPLPDARRIAPEWKVAPALAESLRSGSPAVPALIVRVAGSAAESHAGLEALLAARGLSPAFSESKRGITRVGFRVSGDVQALVQELAELRHVVSIDAAAGATLLNSDARRIVQSATTSIGGETVWARGLHGEGEVIAVLDTGADPTNCYLREGDTSLPPVTQGTSHTTPTLSRRKIIAYNMLYSGDDPADGLIAYENQGHGTYVSGNAAASAIANQFGTDDNTQNGVAPAAKLVIQDGGFDGFDQCSDLAGLGCPVIDLTPALEQAYFQGARIHNNSWGDREEIPPYNLYTAACEDFDDIAWRRPDFLGVLAAGNGGSNGFELLFDVVSSPSTAKNVISVAGTRSPAFEEIVSFSSNGWAVDGRIKPDLAAPAQTVSSRWRTSPGNDDCRTGFVQGTSMASPVAAGSAALVRQYFAEGWHVDGTPNPAAGINPSAALVKATLINGAAGVSTEPPPPSRRQGWGRVHLESALMFGDEPRRLFIVDDWEAFGIGATEPRVFNFFVRSGGGPVNVTLVYTDYPALAMANPALVNDIDLVVEHDGRSHRGNNFDAGGFSVMGGERDVINNVEGVRLDIAGTAISVRVEPRSITHAPQGFALVVSGAVDPIEGHQWIYY